MNSNTYHIESGSTSCLEWSMVKQPAEGESECGDMFLIKEYQKKVLLAVIDGLGHGASAARISRKAKKLLETFNGESLINLINRCHNKLKNTRGAVMSMALINMSEETITWLGVGNVEGVLMRATDKDNARPETIQLRRGIVGYNLPMLQASIVQVTDGDLLFFSTDGVKNNYLENLDIQKNPDEMVRQIASNYFKTTDDALILTARFVGNNKDENSG